ncbi:EFR1 family ferrodoxin [Candidatus Harpocratesius sp.]
MQFAIFYFSGTGNTWWVAKSFCEIAIEKGHQAHYYSIENSETANSEFIQNTFNEADVIGFAYPIYGSTLPNIMRSFLEKCVEIFKNQETKPDQKNKQGIILTTMALFSGDGALVPRKYVKSMGLRFTGAMNLQMASNLGIPYFRYNPVDLNKLGRRMARNRRKMKKLIYRLENGRTLKEGRNPLLIIGGWLQRVFMESEFKIMSNMFSIDPEICTKCMLCVSNCPTQNIVEEKGQLIMKDLCTACMRCYNFCPTHAIKVFKRYAPPKKFKRFKGPISSFNLKVLSENK